MSKFTFIFLALAVFNAVVIMINSSSTLEFWLAGSIVAACSVCAILVKLILDKSN